LLTSDEGGFVATPREISLRGVTEAVTVYEIKGGALSPA
jgi:hypothetical protein